MFLPGEQYTANVRSHSLHPCWCAFFFLLIVLGAHLGINDGIMPLLTYCHNIDYRVNVLWLRFICNFLFEHCSFIFLCPV